MPAATNAHGTSSSTQYPKPATYGSGYGNYDTIGQTQDYSKTGYVGNNQAQKGGGVNPSTGGSTGSELSGMYGKSHTALGKVNVSFILHCTNFHCVCFNIIKLCRTTASLELFSRK